MPDWTVPLADVRVPESDIARVAETYRSGWLSMGPETEGLEHEFARYTGTRHGLAVANGTAGLHLMCAAAGIGPGDEVIVPSLTFVATANAIAYTGAKPVFADIAGLQDPWLSCASCEAALSERTVAILAMSYGGHSGQIEQLSALAKRRGLMLLEDAAHAAGSRLHGRHLGSFGGAGAFSLFSNKNLAVGEGGIVITDDDELAARMRLLRSHGMTTLTWDRHRGHVTGYDVVALGFNYRIDEPRSALARIRLSRLDEENAQRRALDERYREKFAEMDGVILTMDQPASLVSSHHLFALVLEANVDRDAFRTRLAERGIQTSLHYPPAHRFSIYANGQQLPLTDAYAARAVTLPMFAHMTAPQQDLVIDAVRLAVSGRARGH
jgi:dTDP-4-amino-4,6-dideoxygalactose transaminase